LEEKKKETSSLSLKGCAREEHSFRSCNGEEEDGAAMDINTS
jgi:hypothetical protein